MFALFNYIIKFAKPFHNVILIGDFNVKPESVTGQFMIGMPPDAERLEIKEREEFVISECTKLYDKFNYELFNKFNFLNCYSEYVKHRDGLGDGAIEKWEDGFPEMSNYTPDFKAWIDHILISRNGMRLISLKEMPTTE